MTARTTKLKKQNINSNNNKNDIQPNQSDNNKNQNSNDNTVDKLNPQEKNDIPNYTLEPEPEEKIQMRLQYVYDYQMVLLSKDDLKKMQK